MKTLAYCAAYCTLFPLIAFGVAALIVAQWAAEALDWINAELAKGE